MIDMNPRASKRSNTKCRFYCATANNGYRKQFELAKRWAKQDITIELSKLSRNLVAASRKGRGGICKRSLHGNNGTIEPVF